MSDLLPANGHKLPSNGLMADPPLALGEEFGTRKEQKKRKKKQKKAEERMRRETLERMDAAHPRLDETPLKQTEKAPENPKHPAMRLQAWLRPVTRSLDTERTLTAQKSSFVIGINCLMLAITAHAIFSGLDAAPLRWAMLPLALTNVLSLTFAILSAQVGHKRSALDELWAMPADEYAPAVAAILQDKDRAYTALSTDLQQAGSDLNRRQAHLRTAYSVLLGGIIGSAVVFALCVAAWTA